MKLGRVIGRVTLSKGVPSIQGGRWLVVSPFTREQYQRNLDGEPAVTREPSLVIYDNLGAGVGHTVGYIEGREAAMPFPAPTPIDAINAALIDQVFYSPPA